MHHSKNNIPCEDQYKPCFDKLGSNIAWKLKYTNIGNSAHLNII